MTEKNYTEYERDLRDFEKKPLAKDRETLIFPPESDTKGSDDQDASVLPVAPKLSMRKKAEALHEKDKVRVTDSNSYYYGQEGRVTGSHFSQSGDSEVRFTVEFEDGSQGKFGEKQLQKTFSTKNETKKISVNDKILTSTKKTARIVAISDDIVFWVSVDGEKDFGSDFVDEVELFEEHEPFERHRRERGHEPVDEGIVKEIPMEEKVGARKTEDEYQLWVNYGSLHGWEHEITEFTLEEAKQRRKEYAENAPEYPTKIVHKRVPLEEKSDLASKNRRKKKADYEDYDENEDEFADIEGSPSSARIIDEIEKDWDNFEKIYLKGDLTAADALSKWLEDEDRDYAVHVSEFDLVLGWLLKDHHRFQ